MSFISRFRDFGPVKYLMSKTVVEGATLRTQQEQLDMYRAAVLLKGHDWFTQNVSTEGNVRVYKQPEQSDVEKFYADVDCMLPKAIQALVQRSIDTQIRDMFTKIHAAQSATPKVESSEDKSQSTQPSSALLDSLGFELECRESKIPNAGKGVFIKGEVAPGTVIALFPGTIHLAEFARGKDYLKSLMPDDNFNLMMRFDGHIIDSRGANAAPKNPYALGHRINHIPRGAQPNCLQIPFDFPYDPMGFDDFPAQLKKFLPYRFFEEKSMEVASNRSSHLYGMILIAARPLSTDDELYVDYRLNPSGELPSWYHLFDKTAAERRWVDDNPTVGSVLVNKIADNVPFSNTLK